MADIDGGCDDDMELMAIHFHVIVSVAVVLFLSKYHSLCNKFINKIRKEKKKELKYLSSRVWVLSSFCHCLRLQ